MPVLDRSVVHRVGERLGRLGWSVIDGGLSSSSNFLLSFVVATNSTPAEFGGFGIVLTTYILAIGFSRALCCDPLLVRFSRLSDDDVREAARSMTTAALFVGLATAAGAAIAAWSVVPHVATEPMLLFALSAPALLVQDALRYVFFAMGRPWLAAKTDLVWAVLAIAAIGVALVRGSPSVAVLVALWGAAGAVAAVIGFIDARFVPQLRRPADWFRSQLDLGGRFAVEYVTSSGSSQIALYGVAAVAGLPALGAIRAAGVLFGPITVLSMGASVWAIPEAAQVLSRRAGRLLRFTVQYSAALAAMSLVWTLLLAATPDRFGAALFGGNWKLALSVLGPFGVMTAALSFSTGPVYSLRAMGAAKQSLRTRGLLAPPRVLFVVGGAVVAGAAGAMWASFAVTVVGGAVWWIVLNRTFDRHIRGKGDVFVQSGVL